MSASLPTCSKGQLLELAQGHIQFSWVYLQGWKLYSISGCFFSLVFCHSLVKLKEKTEQSLKLGVVLQICLTTKEKGRITCLCLLAAVQLLQPGMWLISGAQLLTLVQLVLFCKQKSFCKSNFFLHIGMDHSGL